MQITIEKKALQTLLNTILSCKCPVTEETERALFKEYFNAPDSDPVDFSPVLKAADTNPQKTPVHIMLEFCTYAHDDPFNFTITHNDVIRLFSGRYHLTPLLSNIDPLIVTDTAGFVLSHMLLPCHAIETEGQIQAEYNAGERTVRFLNCVLPPELVLEPDIYFGVHLGTVVTRLNREQVEIVENHLGLMPEFALATGDVTEVDMSSFQRYGNYRAEVINRFKRHFPELP